MRVCWVQIFSVCFFLGVSTGVQADENPPLQTVSLVDLKRYLGSWYEIARFPNRFQKKCFGNVIATYTLREDGDLKVLNQCKKADGSVSESEGKAWVTDEVTQAKLRVRFFWPFSGKYWIIDLDSNYQYAVVSEPDREYLWILSRTPTLDPGVYMGILDRLKQQKFDLSKLQKTPQG